MNYTKSLLLLTKTVSNVMRHPNTSALRLNTDELFLAASREFTSLETHVRLQA